MDELKASFAGNLIRLRTAAGMTQAELGEALHYTDKAVSKWERAESVPDAWVLTELGRIFGVTVDQLLSASTHWSPPPTLRTEKETYSRLFILLSSIAAVWTLCMVEFVVVWIVLGAIQWIVFVAAVLVQGPGQHVHRHGPGAEPGAAHLPDAAEIQHLAGLPHPGPGGGPGVFGLSDPPSQPEKAGFYPR